MKHSTHIWTALILTWKGVDKKKIKQKNNKQADEPKQNETEIYKRASEEYITHAQ